MRNTRKLKSEKTLKSGAALGGGGQLIPLKSLGSRKRLRARSEKKSRWFREKRAPFVADYLGRHPWCQFQQPLRGGLMMICGQLSVDVHEILPQGRGGAAVPVDGDESNMMALCRYHHQWITSNPKDAKRLGYTR